MSLLDTIDSEHISWQGRWTPTKPRTSTWGASFFLLRTDAPKIVLETGPGSKEYSIVTSPTGPYGVPCIIFWRVGDGEIQQYQVKGAGEIVLADDQTGCGERLVEFVFGEFGGYLELASLRISEGHNLSPVFAPSPQPPLQLLFIGASQTSGFSPPLISPPPLPHGSFTSWPLIFTRTLRSEGTDVRTVVTARPGIRICSGKDEAGNELLGMDRRFWEGWEGVGGFAGVDADKARVVFISIGSNDFATGVPLSEYLTALRAFLNTLVTRLSPTLAHIVFVTPFGFHRPSLTTPGQFTHHQVFEPDTRQLIDSLSDEWEEKGYVEQVWHCDTAGWVSAERCKDGLHFDERGHEDVASRLREWCEKNLRDVF